ncbi:MAG: hypothetical protein CFE44_10745 [Burkholderiales bacterium PBB4]|nr:MAG: hypothetical protein CFE44_10745 [Burkholderiales bacterium PBB4]
MFGTFTLQRHERRLLRDGQPVLVGARAFDVLCVLVENSGQLVTKNALLNAVWPGLVVEENNLQVHVSSLRRILGANAISTVPSRGYRFTLRVASAPAPSEEQQAPAVVPTPAHRTFGRIDAPSPYSPLPTSTTTRNKSIFPMAWRRTSLAT